VLGEETHQAIAQNLLAEGELGETLEVGCGSGHFTVVAAKNATYVVGLDSSESMLKVARARLEVTKNVLTLRADCEELPFPRSGFDTVLMTNVLMYVNASKALSECQRVLRPNGVLILAQFSFQGTRWMDVLRRVVGTILRFGIPPFGRNEYSLNKLARTLRENGFSNQSTRLVGGRFKAIYARSSKQAPVGN